MSTTFGLLTVGATITYIDEDEGTPVAVEVTKDDTLTDIVISTDSYGSRETIAEATLLGITARPRTIIRGSTRVYDGVPTYLPDPDGGGYWRTIEETNEVAGLVLSVPAAEEGGTPTKRMIFIDQLISLVGAEKDDEGHT